MAINKELLSLLQISTSQHCRHDSNTSSLASLHRTPQHVRPTCVPKIQTHTKQQQPCVCNCTINSPVTTAYRQVRCPVTESAATRPHALPQVSRISSASSERASRVQSATISAGKSVESLISARLAMRRTRFGALLTYTISAEECLRYTTRTQGKQLKLLEKRESPGRDSRRCLFPRGTE